MEDREFEELAKALANGQPRRRIVKAIAGSAVAGALGLFGRASTTVAAATTTTTKRPTTTTTTKRPTTTTTTKRPTTTTTTKRPNQACYHSSGPNGGCKGACTAAGFTGGQCNRICGSGQFTGYCPVGQGGGNPCCSTALCYPENFTAGAGGNPVFTGPFERCPASPPA